MQCAGLTQTQSRRQCEVRLRLGKKRTLICVLNCLYRCYKKLNKLNNTGVTNLNVVLQDGYFGEQKCIACVHCN